MKVKLRNYIEKVSIKASDLQDYSYLEALGVSNIDGITKTSHIKSKDLSKYLYIEENYFAYNPYRINVGSIGLTPKGTKGLVSPAYVVFKTTDKLKSEILFDFLKSFEGLQQINKLARGTVRKALRYEDLCNIELIIPSIEKQEEILQLRKNVKQHSQKLENEISYQQKLLKKLKQSILQEAIEGKLTAKWREENQDIEPASTLLEKIKAEKEQLVKEKKIRKPKQLPEIGEDEIPFEIPNSWEWCRLGDTGVFERGKSKHRPRNDEVLFKDGRYPFVQTGDIAQSKKNNYIVTTFSKSYNEIGLSQSRLWSKGTFCITIAANIAETGFLGMDACFPDSVVGYSSVETVISRFIQYFFIVSKNEIVKYAPATAQKNINLGIINELMIPFPPLKEQKEIVKQIEKIFALCDDLETQINSSKQNIETLMQTVLKEAFEQKEETQSIPKEMEVTVASAYILDSFQNNPKFGRVKFQKMLYLYEIANNLDFGSNYQKIQHRMGPHDYEFLRKIEDELKQQEWFDKHQEEGEKGKVSYPPLQKVDEYKEYIHYIPKKEALDKLIALMVDFDLQQSEVVATLYAVWKEEKQKLFDFDIEDKVLIAHAKKWHPEKDKISYKQWVLGVQWLKENEFIL